EYLGPGGVSTGGARQPVVLMCRKMTAIARVLAAASPESFPVPCMPSGLGGDVLSTHLGLVDFSAVARSWLSLPDGAQGHGSHPLTGDLALVLVVAAATALIVRRLRLPTVLGYLA